MMPGLAARLFRIAGAACWLIFLVQQAGAQPNWQHKLDPLLLAQIQSSTAGESTTQTEFLVQMAAQADLSGAADIAGKRARGTFVYEQLTSVARQSQESMLQQLAELGVKSVRPFWITNMVWVRGDLNIVTTLAQRRDVTFLHANPKVALDVLPPDPELGFRETIVTDVEWNISHIRADLAWAAGFTGEGVVIGGQDTGFDWDHPALINQYRGRNGASVDHNYSWHDAITVNNPFCPGSSPEPCDDFSSSHGTHTMGTMVGNDLSPTADVWPAAAANAVGVAPGARWIGCRNMNLGSGSPATYMECFEWFVAPYPLGGDPMTDGDPGRAPHVINNSWSCPPGEGCSADVLESVVDNVRAAGIVTVHAAGNSGPNCATVEDPAGTYAAALTVGAADSNDTIASFSSRGPSTYDGGLKPDITAPGLGIRSTIRDGAYGFSQGTSMAAPHVSGLVALLISANPALAGDVAAIETIVQNTAVPLASSQGCGGDGPTDVPNHVYGYGRIDAFSAILQQFPNKLYLPFSNRE